MGWREEVRTLRRRIDDVIHNFELALSGHTNRLRDFESRLAALEAKGEGETEVMDEAPTVTIRSKPPAGVHIGSVTIEMRHNDTVLITDQHGRKSEATFDFGDTIVVQDVLK